MGGDSLIDWAQIRTEYITTDTSYRQLAEKYGVANASVARHAKTEDWVGERERYWNRVSTEVVQRVQESTIDEHVDAAVRISEIADRLIDKLDTAVEQLDRYMVQDRTRRKVTTYGKSDDDGKQTIEVVDEEERKRWIQGDIDRAGLKQLASTLRDLKEIKGIRDNDSADDDGTGVIVLGDRENE